MRLRVTFLALCLAQAWPGLWADTIHLKNGRKILADHVRENGNRYQYEVGDDSYGIPKSAVDHVEAGGFAARSSATEKLGDLPSFDSAAISLAKEGDLTAKIIRDGKVDQAGLSTLEAKGNPVLSSTANFIAGEVKQPRRTIPIAICARAAIFRERSPIPAGECDRAYVLRRGLGSYGKLRPGAALC